MSATPQIIRLTSPTRAELVNFEDPLGWINEQLKYRDQKVEFELRRMKKPSYAHWFISKNSEEEYRTQLEGLKAEAVKTLVHQDGKGRWTHPGLIPMILDQFPSAQVVRDFSYPEPDLLPWFRDPTRTPRPYQVQFKEALLAARHGSVEVATGLGKSFGIMLLLKELGLRSLVMAPSTSIANQLRDDLAHHLGDANVGLYGDGRKDVGRLLTVGISASLSKIERGTPAWKWLSGCQVFVADESHMCPADTLAKVCLGLAASAPYRFFLSGTQMRADGRELLLRGIIGEVVFRMTLKEGVDQGYLAKPLFRMLRLTSPDKRAAKDPNADTRRHLFKNPAVNAAAGAIANQMVKMGRQTLILVDEVHQLAGILPHLRHKPGFAHGGLNSGNVEQVPEEYRESNPKDLVAKFNAGELPVLVGTSCIATGTDVRANGATVYLMGGQSEVQVRQGAIGRSSRGGRLGGIRLPWSGELKEDCFVFDFDVRVPGIDFDPETGEKLRKMSTTHRHAAERAAVYRETYPSFEMVGAAA